MEKTNIFKYKPLEVHFTIRDRVPYNKLLNNLACSNRTGEYWASVVFVRTERSEVRTATTSGQYSPVRLEQARLVRGYYYLKDTTPVPRLKQLNGHVIERTKRKPNILAWVSALVVAKLQEELLGDFMK